MLSQWGQDPLAGNPRYTSIRTLNHSGRTFLQLALDSSTGEKVAIKFTQRGVWIWAHIWACLVLLILRISADRDGLVVALCHQQQV